MSISSIIGASEQGLIYAVLALGVFISFKVLNMPDLTIDGSFVTGMAVSVMFCQNGYFLTGIILAGVCGALCGMITGLAHTKLKMSPILAGVLVMTALYSINLRIMGGKPNIALLGTTTLFIAFEDLLSLPNSDLILMIIITFILSIVLFWFLKTQLGLALIATGDNEDMVNASSVNPDAMKLLGLALANAFVGISGAIYSQYMQFSDVSGGTGMMVTGIASIIVGSTLIHSSRLSIKILSVAAGSVIYRLLISLAMQLGMKASDLNLISSLLVAIVISFPVIRKKFSSNQIANNIQ